MKQVLNLIIQFKLISQKQYNLAWITVVFIQASANPLFASTLIKWGPLQSFYLHFVRPDLVYRHQLLDRQGLEELLGFLHSFYQ